MSEKVVFITGAARGLGAAIAERFLQDGYRVLAFDINEDNLRQTFVRWSAEGRVMTYTGDVCSRDNIQEAVDKTLTQWGCINVLANVAGIAMEEKFLDINPEDWQQIIDVNLTGIFNVAQIIARQMAKQSSGGVIINMSSKNGINSEVKYAHYNASKAGVILLTKTMAVELAGYNIRVNAVAPGYIVTPLSLEMDQPEFVNYYCNKLIPLGRVGYPKEVAGVFSFLASDDASFITGHTLIVDGGQLSHDGRLLGSYIS